jgi:transposase InsO family protein
VHFQQDGARSHTARRTRSWLETNGIRTINHPANSPDVSPIERGWFLLKKRIRARPHTPTSLEELKQAAIEEWDKITVEELARYTNMQARIDALIAADGGHTRY